MDNETFDLLIDIELSIDHISDMIKEAFDKKDKTITQAQIDLIQERRRLINLSKKIHKHLKRR